MEKDSMGPVKVPSHAYYGAQTQRAVDNFPISAWRFPRVFLQALGPGQTGCKSVIYRFLELKAAKKALTLMEAMVFDVVVLDVKMPGMDGMKVLEFAMEHSPDSICIILTGYGTVKNAVEAIKMGAFDFLAKPFTPEELKAAVYKSAKHLLVERARAS
jgi:FixJ family two-component response regulator